MPRERIPHTLPVFRLEDKWAKKLRSLSDDAMGRLNIKIHLKNGGVIPTVVHDCEFITLCASFGDEDIADITIG